MPLDKKFPKDEVFLDLKVKSYEQASFRNLIQVLLCGCKSKAKYKSERPWLTIALDNWPIQRQSGTQQINLYENQNISRFIISK